MNKTYSFAMNGGDVIIAIMLIVFLVQGEYITAMDLALFWGACELVCFIVRRLIQISRLKK